MVSLLPGRYGTWALLSLLGTAVGEANLANSPGSTCAPFGCPLNPLEIEQEDVKDALEILSEVHHHEQTGFEIPASQSEKVDALTTLVPAGDGDKTTLTLRGDKGEDMKINQDSAVICSPFTISNHEKITSQMMGVFDGHGDRGEETSRHAAAQLPKLLESKLSALESLNDEDAVKGAIQETFIEIDKTDPTGGVGGSTATMILQLAGKLYVANAGDSRSFVAGLVDESVEVFYTSREDKPDLPEERERITKAGGYVHIPSPNDDVPRAYAVDADGNMEYGIAMSRVLGDWAVKGAIAEPIVDVLDIADMMEKAMEAHEEDCEEIESVEDEAKFVELMESDDDSLDIEDDDEEDKPRCILDAKDVHLLAVASSDGIADVLQPSDVAYVYAAAFFVPNNPHPHTASEHIIDEAAEKWEEIYGDYRDDIVVAAFKVYVAQSIIDEVDREFLSGRNSTDKPADRDEL